MCIISIKVRFSVGTVSDFKNGFMSEIHRIIIIILKTILLTGGGTLVILRNVILGLQISLSSERRAGLGVIAGGGGGGDVAAGRGIGGGGGGANVELLGATMGARSSTFSLL